MQPAEALGVAAQVAVTLAGFAGIVVVFRPRSVHEWPALDQFRLRLLLTNSAMPLASALFGILLLTFDPPPVAIWRWCSGLALVMQVPFIINSTTARKRVPAADFAAVSKAMFYIFSALGLSAIILQIINLAAWNLFWPFFLGIFVHLLAAIAQFVRFLVLPHEGK